MRKQRGVVAVIVGLVAGCGVAVTGVAPAGAQFLQIYAETSASQPMSVYCRPDGAGQPLSAVYAYGGAIGDATITVTLLDEYGNPIQGYPPEDIWLEGPAGSTLVFCIGGHWADGPTDQNGQTTFSQAVQAGGQLFSDAPPGGLMVMVAGMPAESENLWLISMNSTDLDGDLQTNLTDVAMFAESLFGDYAYRADFVWDGAVNLADVAAFTQGLSSVCP